MQTSVGGQFWRLSRERLGADEVKKISKAAIKNVKDNFTKEIMCDKTIKVYQELVNNN